MRKHKAEKGPMSQIACELPTLLGTNKAIHTQTCKPEWSRKARRAARLPARAAVVLTGSCCSGFRGSMAHPRNMSFIHGTGTPRCPRQMGLHINNLWGIVPSTLRNTFDQRPVSYALFQYDLLDILYMKKSCSNVTCLRSFTQQ